LAIECDGASYHSSKNARDRDRLRQSILERMGWRFYRIWSTDWFKNNLVEKEKLLCAVLEALNNLSATTTHYQLANKESTFVETTKEEHFQFPKYEIEKSYDIKKMTSRNFQEMIKTILQKEAPLSEEWLLKRIIHLFDREKVTSYVQDEYESLMYNCSKKGIIQKDNFLYLSSQKEIQLRIFDKDDKESLREIKYICLDELAAGMYELIKQNITVEIDGLYTTIAKLLGVTRAGKAIHERFDEALKLLENKVSIDGKIISIKK
jgi:hypothetical protein